MSSYEYDPSHETVQVRQVRLEQLIGRPTYFRASDVMPSPFGDKNNVPVADYLRMQPDNADGDLLVSGIVEGVICEYTPQYLKDPTQKVPLVHLRHAEISGQDGHILLAGGAPRAYVRLDKITPGTIEDLDQPQQYPQAA